MTTTFTLKQLATATNQSIGAAKRYLDKMSIQPTEWSNRLYLASDIEKKSPQVFSLLGTTGTKRAPASNRYKGVKRNTSPSGKVSFSARLYLNGATKHLGTFDTEEEAARAYAFAAAGVAQKHLGTNVNTVETPTPVKSISLLDELELEVVGLAEKIRKVKLAQHIEAAKRKLKASQANFNI